jgi:hypothetical protein
VGRSEAATTTFAFPYLPPLPGRRTRDEVLAVLAGPPVTLLAAVEDRKPPSGRRPGRRFPTRRARPGETVFLFATGCGPTSPVFPAGQVVTAPMPALGMPVQIRIGGVKAQSNIFFITVQR